MELVRRQLREIKYCEAPTADGLSQRTSYLKSLESSTANKSFGFLNIREEPNVTALAQILHRLSKTSIAHQLEKSFFEVVFGLFAHCCVFFLCTFPTVYFAGIDKLNVSFQKSTHASRKTSTFHSGKHSSSCGTDFFQFFSGARGNAL